MVSLRDLHCDPAQPGRAAAALEAAELDMEDLLDQELLGSSKPDS